MTLFSVECQTTDNCLRCNKMKRFELRGCTTRGCVARLQQERREETHFPHTVGTAENEPYTGIASSKVESGEWTERLRKDKMQKYLAARAERRVEHVEHLQGRKKRQLHVSTQVAASQSTRFTSLGDCNTSTLANSCISLVKVQRAPVCEISRGGEKKSAGTEELIRIVNARATEKGERDSHFCTVTTDCEQVEPTVTLRTSLVPSTLPSAWTTHRERSFNVLNGLEETLRRGITRHCFSGESSPVSVDSFSATAGCSRHHSEDIETSSSDQIPGPRLQQTSGHQQSHQDHTTSFCAKKMSEATAFHVKRRRSNQSGTAERSVRENNRPLSTWSVYNRNKKKGQPQFPQGSAGNSHVLQAPTSLGRSEEHGGVGEPCDSCLFVHPCLLMPLLPPTSAFTNPCWPPTPSKKRRGLPHVIRSSQAVPRSLSETAADCKKCSFFDSVSGNQHHTLQSPCACARCSLRASAESLILHNSSLSASSSKHWVDHRSKVCVTDKQGQQSGEAPNVIEAAPGSRKRDEAKERKSTHLLQKTHCHRVEKNGCLIEAGHLIQCACCSPWLPIPSSQLMEKKHTLGDGQAGCATSFVKSINRTDTPSEATYSVTATTQTSGHSAVENCRTKRQGRCHRGLRHRVHVVSSPAEGRQEKYSRKLLCETTLSFRGQPPACDFTGKGDVNITPKSPSQAFPLCSGNVSQVRGATDSCSGSKKASIVDDWKETPERKTRADGLAGIDVTVRGRERTPFEALVPQELPQERKSELLQGTLSYKPSHLHEGQTPCAYSQPSPAPQEITHKSFGIKRRTNRTGVEPMKAPQADAHLQPPHPLPVGQRSRLVRVLRNDGSASVRRRLAVCALPLCNDRSLSKLSGPNGSVLLPSIGCGLTVAQSSLGRGSGLGVYAVRPFSVRSRISEYSGLCVDRKVAMLLRSMGTSTHVMRVGMQHQYLVGYRLPFLYGGAGAFVNDGRWYADGRKGPGVAARFQVVYDKKRARDRVYVVATRNIEAGEEIFTSYDNLYWALMG